MQLVPQSDFKRFDFSKHPKRQKFYLRPLTWILSFPNVWKHRTKIERINMNGLKPPYLLLCNHNSFFDFKVTTAAIFPLRANYVVAIDGFIKREWLLRNAVLPESIGKLAKFLKVPVVTLIMNGHHINSPFWSLKERGNRTHATLTQLVTAEQRGCTRYCTSAPTV